MTNSVAHRREGQGRLFGGAARTGRGDLWPRGARAETCQATATSASARSRCCARAVRAPARCRQVRRQGQCRRTCSRVAGAAGARHQSFPICRFPRRSNSLPSRSCWADARCRTSLPNCKAMPNPGASEDWSSARPAQPGFRSARPARRALAGPLQGRAQRRILRSRGAADLAAGPRRDRLSQPEAASPARRRDRRA